MVSQEDIEKRIFLKNDKYLLKSNKYLLCLCRDLKLNIRMKSIPILFLQAIIVLIGILVLSIMIRGPLTEGRAENLDLFSIYADPFILYGYASSIAFFVVLYQAFRLLGYIGRNKLFSPDSIRTLRSIKYCAILLSIEIMLAGLYIMLFHHEDDDTAGFLAMCIVLTFISIVVSTAVIVLDKILQNAVDLKSENDLTI